jgi:hypothetical protein
LDRKRCTSRVQRRFPAPPDSQFSLPNRHPRFLVRISDLFARSHFVPLPDERHCTTILDLLLVPTRQQPVRHISA